jgi:hypothetical protein
MDEYQRRLIEQLTHLASESAFGKAIRESQQQYAQLSKGIDIFIEIVKDYDEKTKTDHQIFVSVYSQIFESIIVAYIEARSISPEEAKLFLLSFMSDYPGVPESSLLTRWSSFAETSLLAKEVSTSNSPLLIWQQYKKLFQAYNEFLNGLLSYLIILKQTAKGKKVKLEIFEAGYSQKIDQFKALNKEGDDCFNVFTEIAFPKIRNAIAHETISMDAGKKIVYYVDGKGQKRTRHEMEIAEFMKYAAIGSYILFTYLAAISLIAVMEEGSESDKSLLPSQLVHLFNYVPKKK